MKRLNVGRHLVLALLWILAATVIACGIGGGPGSTVKDFYRSIDKGNVSTALELLSKAGRVQFGDGVLQSALSSKVEEVRHKKGISSVNITKEDVHGETAKVSLVITYGDGTKENDDETLIKEDGKWRIAISK